MSVALFIVLDNEQPGFNTFVNGKALAKRRDLDETARGLGVRSLSDFISVSDEEFAHVTGGAHPTPPPTALVMKLGLPREPGYLYYLKGNEVWRSKRKSGVEEKIADGSFVRDDVNFFYLIDANGDVVRTTKSPPSKPGEPFFAAEEGLATVRALRAHYAQTPDAKAVVSDLDECEKVLTQAAAKGFRFHLKVDI